MAAGAYNITIEQGSEYGLTVVIKNQDGSRKDLTDYTGRAQIRRKATAPTIDAEFVVLFTEPRTLGEVKLNMPGAVSSTMKVGDSIESPASQFVYDFEIYDTELKPYRILGGALSVSPEVTRQ